MRMTTENQDIKHGERLLNRLQDMLKTQIDMIRKSDLGGAEKLAQQTRLLIAEIDEQGLFRKPQFRMRYDDIAKLYQKLHVMLRAGKETISQELRKIGKGRKMIQAYRHGA